MQTAHLTTTEKEIIRKQTRALFGMLFTSSVLVISLLLALVYLTIGPDQMRLFISVWVLFGLGCLSIFSYIGVSAIRHQVTFSGRRPLKGRRAMVLGVVYLLMALVGLIVIPISAYTAWTSPMLLRVLQGLLSH